MTFSEKLMELRRSKGWSQEQLGEMLGVTRQTVSKWELGSTTPEMEKIAAISDLFGISTDELIKGEPPKATANTATLPEQKPTSKRFHYEYKSERSWHGIPLVHVNVGFGNYRAKGVVAIGNIACGIFSLGLVSAGVVTVGLVSAGVLILSAVVGLGIFSLAAISGGLFAIGGAAVGLFALGGAAVGWTAMGGAAAGTYAIGGMASATNIAFGGIASGHIALGQTTDGIIEINDPTPQAEVREIILRELPDTPGFIVDIVSKSAESIDYTATPLYITPHI
ncbi:MAG: helix-turn-helix domain-containing protein [Oscillospiraceae bacterium]|nr:helix-turn-helix domain-containing protein [Oscillospiraceae bacterium]